MRSLFALVVLLFAGITPAELRAEEAPAAHAWQIGPIIRGRNYSVGMPLHPSPAPRGWQVDIPYPSREAGHVHYLTFLHGPLAGKSKIVMRYRIDAAPGTRFIAQESGLPATLALYFQRRGDNWSGRGQYETFRWYSGHALQEISPGVHEITVDLEETWTPVMGSTTGATRDRAFREALADADRVGFVLGSRQGYGHGIYATGPARLTVLSYEVR